MRIKNKIAIMITILALTAISLGFTITLTGDYYIPGIGDVDSARTVTVTRLPTDTSFYDITTYTGGRDYIYTSSSFEVPATGWDTLAIDYIHSNAMDIYSDVEISVYMNDTTGATPLILPAAHLFNLNTLRQELARIIIYAADTANVIVNTYYKNEMGVK